MRRYPLIIILLIICLGLQGCASALPGQAPTPTQPNLPTAQINPTPTAEAVQPTEPVPTPTLEPLPTPAVPPPERSQYMLRAHLDVAANVLAVEQEVVYGNHTGETLDEILLLVEPNWYIGAFNLGAITWEDGSTATNYTLEGNQLRLPLPAPLVPQGTLRFSLTYSLNIPAQPGIFGYTDNQVVLSHWFPFVPPYREGWTAHSPGNFGEYLVYDSADFDVTITLSDPEIEADLAAPAPAIPVESGYHYTLGGARTFSWALLYGFQSFTTIVDDVEIYAYVFPLHSIAGQASLQTMAKALPVFEQYFGAYPFETLTVVELEIEDGMEFDGIYLLGERWFKAYYGDPKNYLTILSAHEAAHNWWFSQVANDQALEPWLDEALTTYTELIFYEEVYPELVNWWWEYRVTMWEPVGNVDGNIYDYGGYYEAYRQAVYLRGAQFFQALREAMGDEAFFAFLRDYAEQGRYRIMTSEDFFALLRAHSDADLTPILAEYFANP